MILILFTKEGIVQKKQKEMMSWWDKKAGFFSLLIALVLLFR